MSSVDVIVPCYRYGKFLRQCVNSVLAQEGVTVRVLVIDDASPDDTAEVAAALMREDARVNFIRHESNHGHISTYNEGIEWASADYLLILSADDYLLPGALARAAALMDMNPEVGLTMGRAIELQEDGTQKFTENTLKLNEKNRVALVDGIEFINLSGTRNIVSTPTAVVRTRLHKELGGYRQELPHSGDMELWMRFAAASSVGVLWDLQAVYRRHPNNMSLSYTKLPDLLQRRAALDIFFEASGASIPNANRIKRTFFRSLACEAISAASGALNQGELAGAERLTSLAVELSPRVKWSLQWWSFTVKRTLGTRASNALRALVGKSIPPNAGEAT
jgi:glycosyltransferase involved in cell wall biosynthesis